VNCLAAKSNGHVMEKVFGYRTIIPWARSTRHSSVGVLARLTQSGVQHVERHLVALLGTSDGDQTLVVVVLRLVDLDDTATQLAYLVDLGAALSDDRAHHIVGNEDLLGDRLARERGTALHRLLGGGRAWLSRTSVAILLLWLLRASADVGSARGASTVAHLSLRMLHGRLTLLVRHGVLWSGSASRLLSLPATVLIGVTHLAASVLGNVRDDLHAARHNALRTTVTNSVSRSSWAAKALSQLLHEGATNVVSSDVNGVSDTKDHE
jgi:hypothetical protein